MTRVTVVMFILHFKLKHSALAASANSTWVLLKFKQRRQILYLTEIPWGFLSVAFSMLFSFLSWWGIVCIIVIIAWLRTHFLKNKVDQGYITAALSNKCLLTELTEMTRKKKKKTALPFLQHKTLAITWRYSLEFQILTSK